MRLAEDNYVEHRVVFSQTDRRVRAKVAPSVDLEQVSGRIALAESNLLTEYANLHDTTARFQRVVGRLRKEHSAGLTAAVALGLAAAIEKEALEHRRAAWTQHNKDQYFNSYAPTFLPARGRSREVWQASRRNVIS